MKTNTKKQTTNKIMRGFSLVEMIVYVAVLSIVGAALTVTAVSLLSTYASLVAEEEVSEAGTVALERITRELRFARTVDIGASTLGTAADTLVLNTIDASNNPTTLTFSLSGDRVMVAYGSDSPAPLTHDTITVSAMTFAHIAGSEDTAVRVELTVERKVRTRTIVSQFRTFVILRGV